MLFLVVGFCCCAFVIETSETGGCLGARSHFGSNVSDGLACLVPMLSCCGMFVFLLVHSQLEAADLVLNILVVLL